MEFQLSYFKSWKMMLWKCCTQYASTLGRLSSGHRTGKGQISFQSQRKAMPKNAQSESEVKSLSCVRLLATPWTAAYQAPPSMGFSRQEYWSGVPLPSPKNAQTTTQFHSSHTLVKECSKFSKARLQQYVNHELPDVHAGFRKGRGTRDQIANICWIIKRLPEKHLFLLYWLCQSLWLCGSL